MDDDAINALIKIASKEVSYVQLVKPFKFLKRKKVLCFHFFSNKNSSNGSVFLINYDVKR